MPKTERVLVFAPMPSEMRPVVKLLGLERTGEQGKLPVYTGRCGDTEVVLTGTGVGPALAHAAAERMLAGSTFDRVIVCGIAGGLAPASLSAIWSCPRRCTTAPTVSASDPPRSKG